MTTIDLTDLLPAEQRLLDAALAGKPCNLIPVDAQPTHEEIIEWNDSDREIRGLELAGRSSVALLRSTAGVPALTGIGTVTDIALRLLVPVLLALAALAIRGRTKR